MTAKEPGNVLVALQGRHVDIEIHIRSIPSTDGLT